MRMRRLLGAAFIGILFFLMDRAAAREPEDVLRAELALKSVGLATDGQSLLDVFRQRTESNVDRERLQSLIKQLGHKDFAQREKATAELFRIGPPAISLLQQTVHDAESLELRDAAQRCLKALRPPQSSELVCAAARLLARRSPSEATAILSAYLPVADDDAVLDEIKTTLTALAYRNGSPDPALAAALQDPVALRRAVAADALGDSGIAQPREAFRKLLEDSNSIVRYRAAVALTNAREPQAVTELIALLTELPASQAKEAEELLHMLAAERSPTIALGNTAESRQQCRDAWAMWWKAIEDNALLDEVRRRTYRPADNNHVAALIRQLGDDNFAARQEAQTALKTLGKVAIPALRHAGNDSDLEISTRAQHLLLEIDRESATPMSGVVLRLVAFRKPAGASETLLAFLTFAEDGNIPDDVQDALNAIAYATGQPDQAIQQALTDASARVRAAAVEALCARGISEKPAGVVALLQDPDSLVRVRAALALTRFAHRDSVPLLIDAVAELPADRAVIIEDYLQALAGERPPALPAASNGEARQKRRDAWAAWWKNHGAQTPIVAWNRAVDQSRYYGYTLLALPQSGQVVEIGLDGKTRWQIAGLSNPMDVEVLPGNRVLIAEHEGGRVTERNFNGEILWQHATTLPLGCQRLPNGNTFIVTREQLLEIDRAGKEVTCIKRPMQDIMAARKLRDGQIAMVTRTACLRTDAAGKELHNFALPNGPGTYFVDITPKGTILIPQSWTNKVFEFDVDGKTLSEVHAQQPMAAARLRNGNTLVACQISPPKVLEIDRTGKTVWEHQPATPPGRIKRR